MCKNIFKCRFSGALSEVNIIIPINMQDERDEERNSMVIRAGNETVF